MFYLLLGALSLLAVVRLLRYASTNEETPEQSTAAPSSVWCVYTKAPKGSDSGCVKSYWVLDFIYSTQDAARESCTMYRVCGCNTKVEEFTVHNEA
jgi:hypothetical protein